MQEEGVIAHSQLQAKSQMNVVNNAANETKDAITSRII